MSAYTHAEITGACSTEPRDPASYTHDEMIDLLNAAASVSGDGDKAAVHLVSFTTLPGRSGFARHVEVDVIDEAHRPARTGAWIDWDSLIADPKLRTSGGPERLLQVAASYAAGRPVDLRSAATGLGWAHAKRVVEAVVIGAGVAELYTITSTQALADLLAQQASYSAPSS